MLVRFAPRRVSPDCPALAGEGNVGTSSKLILRTQRAPQRGGWRSWEGVKKMGRRLHESFLQCQIDGMWPRNVSGAVARPMGRQLACFSAGLAPKLPECDLGACN